MYNICMRKPILIKQAPSIMSIFHFSSKNAGNDEDFEEKGRVLAKSEHFKALNSNELKMAAKMCGIAHFKPGLIHVASDVCATFVIGEIIFEAGSEDSNLYIIAEGYASVTIANPLGDGTVTVEASTPECFGESCITRQRKPTETVRATTSVSVVILERGVFQSQLSSTWVQVCVGGGL